MTIVDIFRTELHSLKNNSHIVILFNMILAIWLMSIPAKNSIYQISVILIPAICIFHIIRSGKILHSLQRFNSTYREFIIAFLIVIAAMALSNILNHISDFESWRRIIYFFSRYILILFSLLYLYEENFFTKKSLIIFILIALSIYSIHGVYEILFITKGLSPVQSFVYNRNPFGLTMLAGIITSTLSISYLSPRKPDKLVLIIILVLLFFFTTSLLFSYSRTAWLATGLFILSFGLLNTNFIFKHKISISLFSCIVIFTFFINKGLSDRFLLIIQLYDNMRFEIWEDALSLTKDHLAFGRGLIDYSSIGLSGIGGVHNSILEILLYMGCLGLITFSLVIFLIIKEIFSTRHYEYIPALLSFLFFSLFNLSVIGNTIFLSLLTVFLFLILSCRKLQRQV